MSKKTNGTARVRPGYIQPPTIDWYIEEDASTRSGELIEEKFETIDGKELLRRRKRVTLIMLSGGVDSVYGLAKLLRESDDVVLAHHIHLINQEGRHKLEATACKQVVEYCKKNYRDFTYTESLIDRRKFKAFGMDVFTAAFEAGIVVQSFHADTGSLVDRWTVGTCAEDLDGFDEKDTDAHRTPQMTKAIEANCHPLKPPYFFNLPLRPKWELVEYMGPELSKMCWYCRRPVFHENGSASTCGECHTCEIMKTV